MPLGEWRCAAEPIISRSPDENWLYGEENWAFAPFYPPNRRRAFALKAANMLGNAAAGAHRDRSPCRAREGPSLETPSLGGMGDGPGPPPIRRECGVLEQMRCFGTGDKPPHHKIGPARAPATRGRRSDLEHAFGDGAEILTIIERRLAAGDFRAQDRNPQFEIANRHGAQILPRQKTQLIIHPDAGVVIIHGAVSLALPLHHRRRHSQSRHSQSRHSPPAAVASRRPRAYNHQPAHEKAAMARRRATPPIDPSVCARQA